MKKSGSQGPAPPADAVERRPALEVGWRAVGLAFTLAFLASTAAAHAASRWTKLDDTPGFSGYGAELQRIADAEGRTRVNHFCVVAESFAPPRGIEDARSPRREIVARVYWREQHQLRTWNPGTGTSGDFEILAGNLLNLRKDVVATRRSVGTSTYLVTRAWVRDVLDHCTRSGTSLEVLRR